MQLERPSSESSPIGDFWDQKLVELAARDPAIPLNWWEDPVTIRHINKLVCGKPIDGLHAAYHQRIGEILHASGAKAPKAISVGSGSGMKELWLLQTGAVASIDCYELGANLVETGRRIAADHGMENRLRMHLGDPFIEDLPADYDLVYWNNSLHHMKDTPAAMAWGRDRLRCGGLMAFDDYVGPDRFQFSDELFRLVNEAMMLLPDRCLRKRDNPAEMYPRTIGRWSAETVATTDPSEASDSGRILPAMKSSFPDAQIIPTGGAIYFLGLNGVFGNFVTEEDRRILQALLLIDHLLAERGETPYAVGFGVKKHSRERRMSMKAWTNFCTFLSSRDRTCRKETNYLDRVPHRQRLPGATSVEEQAYCEWHAAERFKGAGCIVEFGPWLGSLTIPTAMGLIQNSGVQKKEIHSYDLFLWEPGSNGWAAGTPFDRLYQPGDCFKPLYDQLVAPYQGSVNIHSNQADLSQAEWSGEPIEFLINDAWKTMPVMANTVQKFFPALMDGATVFHQDYLWFSESWIHVGMYRLRNHFEMERRVRNSSTVVFRMPSRPSTKLLASFCTLGSLADLREEEVDAAFDWSRSFLVDPDARLVANAGQAWLLHKMGRDDKARRLFAENRASKDWGHPFYQFQETMLREWGYGGLLG